MNGASRRCACRSPELLRDSRECLAQRRNFSVRISSTRTQDETGKVNTLGVRRKLFEIHTRKARPATVSPPSLGPIPRQSRKIFQASRAYQSVLATAPGRTACAAQRPEAATPQAPGPWPSRSGFRIGLQNEAAPRYTQVDDLAEQAQPTQRDLQGSSAKTRSEFLFSRFTKHELLMR